MKPERWKQIEQLYDAALELDLSQRAAFLDQACKGDEELRREVASLLASDAQAESFLAAPAVEVVARSIAAEPVSSPIGRRIGHYQVESLLGVGGMGEVYLAQDTQLGRKLALKLLLTQFTADADRLRRFEREARTASALNHPNIITIFEIGQEGSTHYIATEFIDGETLRQQMESGRIDLGRTLDVAAQIAAAMVAAHEAGITHRDIKPENVMVRRDGIVKMLDFGLAKLIEPSSPAPISVVDTQAPTLAQAAHTKSGVVMGTPLYMSPEQARGLKVDHRTDIFSLGVLLYEMIAGRRPFEGETMSDMIAALLTAEPPPLKQYCAEATAELERIVGRCLAKDREARYQSAKELIAELKTLRTSSQTEDSATRRIEAAGARFVSWRRPVVAALAALLIVGLVWFLVWRRVPAVQPDQIKSLAVLPLENLSGDPAQNYFADGMTETLIAGLAKVGALQVSSRTSVMQYQGTRKPWPDIARELNVDAVVEGSVQRFGERMKITARLIHAPTGLSLWAETYERDLRDALALQSEITRALIQQIQIKLTPPEQRRLASARPVNPGAYDDYLRGRFYANRQNKADNETAIMTLERSVAIDPTFADAYAELAQAYVWKLYLFDPKMRQWEEKAFVAAEKALSLDPDSAVAHLARGRLLWTPANHFPHEKAMREYRRALALNPNLDEARNQLALVYCHIGAFDEALQESQKAVTINPSNNMAVFRTGQTLNFQGKYEQALSVLRTVPEEVNPALVGYQTVWALFNLGRKQEASELIEQYLRDHTEDSGGLFTSVQAVLAASAGQERRAGEKIKLAVARGKGFGHFHHTAYNIACAYALMKNPEQAIKWLEAAANDGFPCYPLFESDPYLDHLRKDSRFIALMAKLKEQWEYYQTRL
jgi:eukaryotic-like serine/threonine-protein kinase